MSKRHTFGGFWSIENKQPGDSKAANMATKIIKRDLSNINRAEAILFGLQALVNVRLNIAKVLRDKKAIELLEELLEEIQEAMR